MQQVCKVQKFDPIVIKSLVLVVVNPVGFWSTVQGESLILFPMYNKAYIVVFLHLCDLNYKCDPFHPKNPHLWAERQ